MKDKGSCITMSQSVSFKMWKTSKSSFIKGTASKRCSYTCWFERKRCSTPADLNVRLQKDGGFSRPVDVTPHQSIAGSLLYAAIATLPDTAQAMGVVSEFSGNPTQNYLTATKRILRYLKATTYLRLRYKKCANGNLIGYSDADWAGDMDDLHSISGNV